MRIIYYMILVFLGIVVSVPMTVILIAFEQALETKEKIYNKLK